MDCAALKLHRYINISINAPYLSPGAARGCSLPMDTLAQPWIDTRLHCLTAHLGGIRRKGKKKRQGMLSALKINSKNAEKF